jgi:Tfp pilus assembly protein PilX
MKIQQNIFQKAFWDKYINDKRGFVLVLTLMLISIMSVLTITTFELVMSTTRITGNHKNYLQALYVADAGVEHTLSAISRAATNFDGTLSNDQRGSAIVAADNSWSYITGSDQCTVTNNDLGGTYTVTLTMEDGTNLFTVESTGTAAGFEKTIVAEISSSARIITWMEKKEI